MSKLSLRRWLCQQNIFDLVQHVAPLFCSGHLHNYFLKLGQAVQDSLLDVFSSVPLEIIIIC
jgi:hypothetical protein